jgi:carbonic anhydrase
MNKTEEIIKELQNANIKYASEKASIFPKQISKQNPKIAVLTCADSRVIPEYIFRKDIGEIFTIRIAGNITSDPSIITSLEYAIEHLKIDLLIIMGHTNCGAVKAAEHTTDTTNELFNEIKNSFKLNPNNHIKANLQRQIEMLPKRSKIVQKALIQKKLKLIGAIYRLEDGKVEFIY